MRYKIVISNNHYKSLYSSLVCYCLRRDMRETRGKRLQRRVRALSKSTW